MRIVSLLPAATEIVAALGAADELVGVSHECDYPAGVNRLPQLTRTRLNAFGSATIHASLMAMVRASMSLYELDVDKLRQLQPDVIVTQDLCAVCGVTFADLQQAAADLLGRRINVVRLNPHCWQEVCNDVLAIGAAVGRSAAARSWCDRAWQRLHALAPEGDHERPRVLTIEWIDPLMIGGLWTPELVRFAGGEPLLATAGEKARSPDRNQLDGIDPDIVVVKPCGYRLNQVLGEIDAIRRCLPWNHWRKSLPGGVYGIDGNAYFNRSGPRLVDSAELLAGLVQPSRRAVTDRMYAHAFVSIDIANMT